MIIVGLRDIGISARYLLSKFLLPIFLVLFIIGEFFVSTKPVFAAVPQIIHYQGRLYNSNNNLLGGSSGTTYYFKFSIWDNAAVGSGTKLWPTGSPSPQSLNVVNGVFNYDLGSTSPDGDLSPINFQTDGDS